MSVAVGSGKGGVGKSTTALNLALLFAKHNWRVGLIDLDPLSNITTILGIPDDTLRKIQSDPSSDGDFSRFKHAYAPGIDIVFPIAAGGDDRSSRKFQLFTHFAQELAANYDLLIFDMPAGISSEENLAFLPYINQLLVVTNAEPTSHVSAGGYIKSALEIRPDLKILFWHNRYRPATETGFNPTAVLENYNRYVPEDLRVDEKAVANIEDVAFVPPDPALNLLQTDVDPLITIYGKIREVLELLLAERVKTFAAMMPAGPKARDLISFFFLRNHAITDPAAYLKDLDVFLAGLMQSQVLGNLESLWKRLGRKSELKTFTADQRHAALGAIQAAARDEVRTELARVLTIVDEALEELLNAGRGFYERSSLDRGRIVLSAVPRVLRLVAEAGSDGTGFSRFGLRTASVGLFYVAAALAVADASDTGETGTQSVVTKVFAELVPHTRDQKGRVRRDRQKQILRLIKRDELYHRRFLIAVKMLFPPISRNISRISTDYGLQGLILRDKAGNTNGEAYVKLLTHLVHDIVNTGLGVNITFTYNAASQAIRKGGERVREVLGLASSS